MSVLSCDRLGCENVMCDRYSSTHGYICDECFEDLVNTGPETNIKQFMNTHKQYSSVSTRDEAFARYNEVFKLDRG